MIDQPIRTLLIEDNPGDARLIREKLREETDTPFSVVVESRLANGLNRLAVDSFDIILLDLSLPDSFGLETIQTVCARYPDFPVVVLTGYDDKNLGIQAVQIGAQDYLTKDEVDSRLLSRTIRYAIERHHIEVALRQSQQEYRSLIDDVFNTSTVGVLILDRDFKIVWLNGAIETYFGIPREELLGEDKRLLIESKLKCIFADADAFSSSILASYRDNTFDQRLECLVTPGSYRQERWLEHWSQPIRAGMYAGGRIEHYTDITQRKRIESSEREKAQKLAAAEERQHLARELHDSVTQTLFTTTVISESALRQWEINPAKAHDLMTQLHQLTTSALAEMRLLLLELRPASLTQQSLSALIQQLVFTVQGRTGMQITTELDEMAKLMPDVQVALYRIVQEALNNVVKHAHASAVHIRLQNEGDQLELVILDNGQGFEIDTIQPSSLGMGIMQERANDIGAWLQMSSSPGHGTTVQVIWPMPEEIG